jgi:hypothetical protein
MTAENMESPKKGIRIGTLTGLLIIVLALAALVLVFIPRMGPPPRWHTSEALAISTLRTISSAQELYKTRFERYASLSELGKAKMIDRVLVEAASPEHPKTGYYFILKHGGSNWSCIALPVRPGDSGNRSFHIDETGRIRFEKCESEQDRPAGPDSPELN